MPRRRTKLPISSASEVFQLEASQAFWDAIQAHAGVLDDGHRTRLCEVVSTYVVRRQLELNAPSRADADVRLGQITTATNQFLAALRPRREPEQYRTEAAIEAEAHVYRLLNRDIRARLLLRAVFLGPANPSNGEPVPMADLREKLKPFNVDEILHVVSAFSEACQHAQAQLEAVSSAQFQEGVAWAAFIEELADFWESLRPANPATAAKHNDRGSRPSPFVSFVSAIQKYFPPNSELARHTLGTSSIDTSPLAKAISLVVRGRRVERDE